MSDNSTTSSIASAVANATTTSLNPTQIVASAEATALGATASFLSQHALVIVTVLAAACGALVLVLVIILVRHCCCRRSPKTIETTVRTTI